MAASEGTPGRTPLRVVLDECERIRLDPNESEERRAVAAQWQDRLLYRDLREPDGYPATILSVVGASSRRHTSGGGWSMHEDMVYDGWAD